MRIQDYCNVMRRMHPGEQCRREVMSMTHEKPKKFRLNTGALAAASLAVVMLGGGGMMLYNLSRDVNAPGTGNVASSLSGGQAGLEEYAKLANEYFTQVSGTECNMNLNGWGMNLDHTWTMEDGRTVTLKALFGDENSLCFLYDVSVPEELRGQKLDIPFIRANTENFIGSQTRGRLINSRETEDGTEEYYVTPDENGIMHCDSILTTGGVGSFTGQTLVFSLMDDNYQDIDPITVTPDFLRPDMPSRTITLAKPVSLEDGSPADTLRITPFGVLLYDGMTAPPFGTDMAIPCALSGHETENPAVLRAGFANGAVQEITTARCWFSKYNTQDMGGVCASYLFNAPLDLDALESLTFNGTTVLGSQYQMLAQEYFSGLSGTACNVNLNGWGMDLDHTWTLDDGRTVTLRALFGTDTRLYYVYDITKPEGFDDTAAHDPVIGLSTESSGDGGFGSGGAINDFPNVPDRYIGYQEASAPYQFSGRTLVFHLQPEDEYGKEQTYTVTPDFLSSIPKIKVDMDNTLTIEGQALNTAALTPFGVELSTRRDNFPDPNEAPVLNQQINERRDKDVQEALHIQAVMTDGTVQEIRTVEGGDGSFRTVEGGCSFWTWEFEGYEPFSRLTLSFNRLVNWDNVAELQINGVSIPVHPDVTGTTVTAVLPDDAEPAQTEEAISMKMQEAYPESRLLPLLEDIEAWAQGGTSNYDYTGRVETFGEEYIWETADFTVTPRCLFAGNDYYMFFYDVKLDGMQEDGWFYLDIAEMGKIHHENMVTASRGLMFSDDGVLTMCQVTQVKSTTENSELHFYKKADYSTTSIRSMEDELHADEGEVIIPLPNLTAQPSRTAENTWEFEIDGTACHVDKMTADAFSVRLDVIGDDSLVSGYSADRDVQLVYPDRTENITVNSSEVSTAWGNAERSSWQMYVPTGIDLDNLLGIRINGYDLMF